MKYLAKSEPARAKTPLFIFLLIGLVCLFTARITPYLRWVFDIGTIVCMSAVGYILLRYVSSSFEYEMKEEVFLVYRLLGKRGDLVFSAQREIIEKIIKYDRLEQNDSQKKPPVHQFCPSFGKKSMWVLMVKGGEESRAWVYIECGEEFAASVQKWIEK